MEIKQITENKKQFLDLLLSADPSEEMIDKYLEKGEMFIMEALGETVCAAVVVVLSDTLCELKNIAVKKSFQNAGLGSKMLQFLFFHYGGWCDKMVVGTAEDGGKFYENNGFVYSHTVKDFFTDCYDEPVLSADGQEYKDMHYYKRDL